jgi:hypothetical protein
MKRVSASEEQTGPSNGQQRQPLHQAKYRRLKILFTWIITFSIADLIRDFFLSLETTASEL